jgi:Tfp pilus assembly protein PilN
MGSLKIMPALALNFVQRRRLASPLGLLLLVGGLAAAGLVAVDYLDARDELERAELRLVRLKRPEATPRPREGGAPSARGDAQTVDRAAARLRLPWDAMLREIETRTNPAVALLGIEAQGQARTVRISGEAKTMADVVAYVSHLRESPWIKAAYLSGHEERQAGAVRVIRFSLDAQWSEPL